MKRKQKRTDIIREAILTRTGEFSVDDIIDDIKDMVEVNKSIRSGIIQNINKLGCTKVRSEGRHHKGFWVSKPDTHIQTKLPEPEPKEELNMAELGESVYAYIGSLKERIQKLADQVSAEQERIRETHTHYKGIIVDKNNTIKDLNQKIINQNKRFYNSNNKFPLSELQNQ